MNAEKPTYPVERVSGRSNELPAPEKDYMLAREQLEQVAKLSPVHPQFPVVPEGRPSRRDPVRLQTGGFHDVSAWFEAAE